MKKTIFTYNAILIMLTAVGCTIQPSSNNNPGPIYTAAAQTIAVTMTYGSIHSTIEAFSNSTATTPVLSATPTVEATPTDTPVPLLTSTPEITLTPMPSIAMISSTMNTNCREKPGGYSPIQSGLMVGQKVAVKGRLAANNWWLIVDPDDSARTCWVWNDTTLVEGDVNSIPVLYVPMQGSPVYTISGSVSPNDYSGSCPVTITVTGRIKANAGSYDDLSYGWTTNFGVHPGGGTTDFKKAGSKTFSASFTISEDTSGYVRFKLYEPITKSTGKMYLHVNCD
jgi:hypothetical protein